MPDRFDSWESYFYPETIDWTGQGTLRNKFDERDADVLHVKEYARAAVRQRELMAGTVDIARTYDAAHVRAIHRHLFQDVYEWAGEYRTVNMSKGPGHGFGDVQTGEVDRYLTDVSRLVRATEWGRLDHDQFAGRAAGVFAYLNQAHPFREGNGRTSKVFLEHVAERSRFTLDYDRVSPEVWNQASMLSGPDLNSYPPVPDSLVPVFRAIAQPRAATPAVTNQGDPHLAQLIRATYPRPATEATRREPDPTPDDRYGSQQAATPPPP